MKIIKLEPQAGRTIELNDITLTPLRVTAKSWFDKKIFMAYPTDMWYYPQNPEVVCIKWVDDLGKRFSDKLTEQFTNYCITK